MTPFDQLFQQQHQISELSHILNAVIQDRLLCDNAVTSRLFQEYTDRVIKHLDLENRTLYSQLLTSSDQAVINIANRHLEGGREINKLFSSFVKRYYRKGLYVRDHVRFVAETHDMLEMVLDRLQSETEELYPLVRQAEGAAKAA